MEAAPSTVGVAVGSPGPPPALPAPPQWPALPEPRSVQLPATPPVWSRSAQVATAVTLAAALGLLGWHAWSSQRRACRPTVVEGEAVRLERLDLNRADRAALLQLPGVGPELARRIEDYRREHGPFRNLDELRRVGGVGPALLQKLRPLVEVSPSDAGDTSDAPVPPAARKKPGGGPVDVNAATAEQLQALPGVGPKMAQRILATRAGRPFRSVEELRRVPGIGQKTLERLRPHVVVGRAGSP
jgi:competence protein ComEA